MSSFAEASVFATKEVDFWPQITDDLMTFMNLHEDWVDNDRVKCVIVICNLLKMGISAPQEALELAHMSRVSRGQSSQHVTLDGDEHLDWAIQFLNSGRSKYELRTVMDLAHCITDVDFTDVHSTRFDVAVEWLRFGLPIDALQVQCIFGKHLTKVTDLLTPRFDVNTCVICHDALSKSHFTSSGCSHNHNKFHEQCIKKWLHQSKTCPLCRESV